MTIYFSDFTDQNIDWLRFPSFDICERLSISVFSLGNYTVFPLWTKLFDQLHVNFVQIKIYKQSVFHLRALEKSGNLFV